MLNNLLGWHWKYTYYVSYLFEGGVGYAMLDRSLKIKSIDDINEVIKEIKKASSSELEKIAIINFILLNKQLIK